METLLLHGELVFWWVFVIAIVVALIVWQGQGPNVPRDNE